ncbi:MAG: hypothetical protein RLZZ299_827 [Pseudomonadota bacterium]
MRIVVIAGPENVGPFTLLPGENVVGRDPSCGVALPSKRVSRRHAALHVTEDAVWVEDLGSQNGVLDAWGNRVSGRALQPGEQVQVGDYVLAFEADADEEVSLDDAGTEESLLDPSDSGSAPVFDAFPDLGPARPRRASTPRPGAAPFTVDRAELPVLPEAGDPAEASLTPSLPMGASASTLSAGFGPPAGLPPPPGGSFRPPSSSPTFGEGAVPMGLGAPAGLPASASPLRPHPTTVPMDDGPVPVSAPPRAAAPSVPAWVPPASSQVSAETGLVQRVSWPILAGGAVAGSLGVLLLAALFQLHAAGNALREASLLRGEELADSVGNRNATAIAEQRGLSLDVAFVKDRAGVRGVMVADERGTVLAPSEKLRSSVATHPAWKDAATSRAAARAASEDGTWEIVTPVRAEIGGSGARRVVGYVVLSYDADVVVDDLFAPGARAAGLVVAALIAALGLVTAGWALVWRPLLVLRDETEVAISHPADPVVSPARMAPMEALAHTLNRVLARVHGRA